jgi:UDP-2,4-diacetamido-2,4,6-trideoxy-beta-L-altropyranose hydrolase
MTETMIVRADASARIGSGHVMRCLALAQAWKRGADRAIFVTANDSRFLASRLQTEGMEVVGLNATAASIEDAKRTVELAQEADARWIVVDGYHFGAEYQQAIKNAGLKLLFIDDHGHAASYHADIIVNQNIHAGGELYEQRDAHTRLLLGTRYSLLRREFLKWQGWKRDIPDVARRLLVTMGGGDPVNATFEVIEALQQTSMDGLEVAVVLGETNPHHEQLEAAVRNSQVPIRLAKAVTDMSELMAWADSAVSAAGSTCWELAFMGLPNIALVLAGNQEAVARQLDSAGIAINLGWHSDLPRTTLIRELERLLTSKELRQAMSDRGRALVDGKGAARVAAMMRSSKLRLRPARRDDCRLLWEWASDPAVRAASFSSAPISWADHQDWFARKRDDKNCFMFIAVDNEDLPIGQARFDLVNQSEAEISVSVSPSHRAEGYGSQLIQMSVKELFRITPAQLVHAFIKSDNLSSIGAFIRAGFVDSGLKIVKGEVAKHFTRTHQTNDKTPNLDTP